MTGSKHRCRALLACTFLFAFFALGSSAQAETGGNWRVEGSNVTESLSPEAVMALSGPHLTANFQVAGQQVKILCSSLAAAAALRLVPLSRLAAAALLLAGCDVSINGKTSAACKPHSKGDPEGTIETLSLKGLLVLHNGSGVIRIEPETGETMAVIVLGAEGESECAIGETLPLRGALTLKDESLSTELVTHSLSEFPALTDLWVLNKTAEHKVTTSGSIHMSLAGAHAGLKWSGLPG